MSGKQKIPINSFLVARQYQRQGDMQKAIDFYEQLINDTNPTFSWYYYYLGEAFRAIFDLEKAINCYQKAIQIKPNSAWLNNCMAEALIQQAKLDDAIQYSKKAISLEADVTVYYQTLALAYESQLDFEQALKIWQQILTINPEHQIAYTRVHSIKSREAQKPKDIEKIALEIWFFLHQKLYFLSQSSIKFSEALDKKETFDFFNQTSKYTFIALDTLTDEDKSKLAENKICLKSLQSIFTDLDTNEENLIHNFSGFEKYQVTKNPIGGIKPFQKSIVETNYIYSICPESQTILRSNLSFFIPLGSWPFIFYRFEGKNTFYLITGAWTGTKIAIYYPISDLVIRVVDTLQGDSKIIKNLLNKFKGKAVYDWKKYCYYCVNKNPKDLGHIIHYTKHLGHTFYADYGGLQYLQSNQLLNQINKVFVGEYNLAKIDKLFSELDKSQIIYSNSEDLFSKSLTENSFLVRSTSFFMSDELVTRFKDYASSSCSSSFKEELSVLANCYPIVWINIRAHNRFWISQDVGFAKVIKTLQQKYSQIAVIFDGWTSLEETQLSSREKAFMEKELAIAGKIKSLVPNVTYKSVIGGTIAEKLEWLKLANFYIISYGGSISFAYLYNIPGIVLSSREHAANNKLQKEATSAHQSIVLPIVVVAEKSQIDENSIRSITNNAILAKMGYYNENFECDADKIYEECISILKGR